jgi:hypothetical protein
VLATAATVPWGSVRRLALRSELGLEAPSGLSAACCPQRSPRHEQATDTLGAPVAHPNGREPLRQHVRATVPEPPLPPDLADVVGQASVQPAIDAGGCWSASTVGMPGGVIAVTAVQLFTRAVASVCPPRCSWRAPR